MGTEFLPLAQHPGNGTGYAEMPKTLVRKRNLFQPIQEKELSGALESLASKLKLSARDLYTFPEFEGPVGIPDLVVLADRNGEVQDRLASEIPPITSLSAARVAAAVGINRPTTTQHISNDLHMSVKQVQRYITTLIASGVIYGTRTGYRREASVRAIGRMYALEAKVSDWVAGVNQAVRYASWADATAVVMLRLPRDRTDATAYAHKNGIGLALGDQWILRPRIGTNPLSTHRGARLFAAECAIQKLWHHELEV